MQPELRVAALLRHLVEGEVDFVVIGGVAVVAHGYVRSTKDLDICFATERANLDALGAVLVGLGARLRGVPEDVPFIPDARALRGIEILTLETAEGDLDLLVRPDGAPEYAELRARAEMIDMDGLSVAIASIDDLIAMKQAADRLSDRADVQALETIARMRRFDRRHRS